jgi:hypothetical protein
MACLPKESVTAKAQTLVETDRLRHVPKVRVIPVVQLMWVSVIYEIGPCFGRQRHHASRDLHRRLMSTKS